MEPSVEQRMEYLIQWWNGRNRHAPRHLFLESFVGELYRVSDAAYDEMGRLRQESDDSGDASA